MDFPFKPSSYQELCSIFGNPNPYYSYSKRTYIVDINWEVHNLVLLNTTLELPKRVYCHKFLAPVLMDVFDELYNKGLQHLIHTWDGCFNPRKISGSTSFSTHTFGISIDINASRNPMGINWKDNKNPEKMDEQLIEIFTSKGLFWGNDFKRPDPMHFSLAIW